MRNSRVPRLSSIGLQAAWQAAAKVFADPFYQKGPNDQGIGWNVLSSLKRVGIGFGLAALIAVARPAAFLQLALVALSFAALSPSEVLLSSA